MAIRGTYSRRRFVKQSLAAAIAVEYGAVAGLDRGATKDSSSLAPTNPAPKDQRILPRWRGFNLTHFFTKWSDQKPQEDYFRWMRDWGFDFIRLPMSYETWTEPGDWYKIKEATLEKIDHVVDWGRRYGIHVSLNFHRGPGYCVNPPAEKKAVHGANSGRVGKKGYPG